MSEVKGEKQIPGFLTADSGSGCKSIWQCGRRGFGERFEEKSLAKSGLYEFFGLFPSIGTLCALPQGKNDLEYWLARAV
ncbi:MAG: hypothetical protein ACPGVZ_06805 [Myxococcota bacterium]